MTWLRDRVALHGGVVPRDIGALPVEVGRRLVTIQIARLRECIPTFQHIASVAPVAARRRRQRKMRVSTVRERLRLRRRGLGTVGVGAKKLAEARRSCRTRAAA